MRNVLLPRPLDVKRKKRSSRGLGGSTLTIILEVLLALWGQDEPHCDAPASRSGASRLTIGKPDLAERHPQRDPMVGWVEASMPYVHKGVCNPQMRV